MKKMLTMMMVAAAVCAQAQQVYVTPTGAGTEDGSSWADAMALEDALAAGGELWLAEGTYIHADAVTFSVPADTSLYGGFTTAMTLFEERNPTLYPTILDGDQEPIAVVTIGGADVTLDGIVITGARGPFARGLVKGVGGDLFMMDCVISNIWLSGDYASGVGANLTAGNIVMTGCVVEGNRRFGSSIHSYGTGIAVSGGATLTMDRCRLSRNDCPPDANGRGTMGGALSLHMGTLRIANTVFEENMASGNGGGGGAVWMGNYGGAITLAASFSNCLFRANGFYANGIDGNGGAIAIVSVTPQSPIEFSRCVFVDNFAGNGHGGAIRQNGGTVTLRNSIFWDNRLTVQGFLGSEIYVDGTGILDADYLCVTGTGNPEFIRIPGGQTLGVHVMTNNPLFASASDFHLKSEAGRWDGGAWVTDGETSPCIDAASDGGELGLYGGTAEASLSIASEPPLVDILPWENPAYTQYRLGGKLTNDVQNLANVLYICYGETEITEETAEGWGTVVIVYPPRQSGVPFVIETPYLKPLTAYFVRIYAANRFGDSWSAIQSFVTGDDLPLGYGVGGGETVVHVRAEATEGLQDGSDWFNAFTTLEAGFAALTPTRPTLWIAEGAYSPAADIALIDGQSVVGGFAGTETTEAQREGNAYTVWNNEGLFRAVTVGAGDVLMDAIIITNTSISVGTETAALKKTGAGTLRLVNCKITGTHRAATGGRLWGVGCHFAGGTVIMERCEVSNNSTDSAETHGIGIYSAANLTLIDCVITRNRASNPNSNYNNTRHSTGFGVYAGGGTLTMIRTEVTDNYSGGAALYWPQDSGGVGVYVGGAITGTVLIQNCLFRNNRCYSANVASGLGGNGAALKIMPSDGTIPIHVINCTFTGNRTDAINGQGGAIYIDKGILTVRNAIFWDNQVTGEGAFADGNDIYVAGDATLTLSYACIDTEGNVVVADTATGNFGNGIFAADPLFVSPADSHLQSKEGYWDRATQSWLKSPNNSPCIGAGDKADDNSLAPLPRSSRINLGAYGGTPFASKTQLRNTLILIR